MPKVLEIYLRKKVANIILRIFLTHVVHFDDRGRCIWYSCGFQHNPCDSLELLNYAVCISIGLGTKSRFQLRESTATSKCEWWSRREMAGAIPTYEIRARQIPVERSSEVNRNLGNASTLRCCVPGALGRKFQVGFANGNIYRGLSAIPLN